MATMIDRMTVNWQGEHEIGLALQFRQTVGARGINKTIKELIREFLKTRKPT